MPLDKMIREIILMTLILLLLLMSFLVPIRKSKDIKDIKEGYIFEIEQTTGPWWRVKEIIDDGNEKLQIGELVYIKGDDPYEKLRSSVLTSENLFYFEISEIEQIYNDELEEYFKMVTVKSWGICYPIQREFGIFSFRKQFLNIYDFKWLL